MKFNYPAARRDESQIDDYFGNKVSDPYRWLEDPDSEETQKFVDQQNKITRPFLDNCPDRNAIKTRLTELWDFPKYGCPTRKGNRYFFYKNSGLQNQSVLYKQSTLDAEPEVFLDPNTLSEDGTVALSGTAFSDDGELFAYGLSSSGSDWITLNFKSVSTGENYPEVLKKVKFSGITWTHDNKGIFYGAYPEQEGKTDGSETLENVNQKLFYHKIGTPQSEDVLVVEFPEEPQFRMASEITDCGRYLIVSPTKACRDHLLYFCDLKKINYEIKGKLPLTQVVYKLEADYDYVYNNGSKVMFRTNKDAPNYRIIEIDFENPSEENWKTVVPAHELDVLDWAASVNKNKLILCYMHHVKNKLEYRDIEGNLIYQFPLDVGTISGFSGDIKYPEIFYKYTSYLTPGIIYRCDLSSNDLTPKVHQEVEVRGFNRDEYTTKQIFYKSKDGTKIPMFIIHKNSVEQNGNNPCLLYGYGGFNISIQPSFSVTRLVFLQHFDGIVAEANIRGGGEYGESWHNGGRFGNKQNVFDDFQAAAEYLINAKYTKPSLLTIQGGSNGGLLVAACINQRPELFGAAICHVPVADMLRFHKFTIGGSWKSDYGSSDTEDDFSYLIKYSPLHNVRLNKGDGVQYPATLVLTADHDDRVVPLHSLKLIATLQHVLGKLPQQKNPLLIRVDTKAGHGAGKPTSKLIDEVSDIMCFIQLTLNIDFKV